METAVLESRGAPGCSGPESALRGLGEGEHAAMQQPRVLSEGSNRFPRDAADAETRPDPDASVALLENRGDDRALEPARQRGQKLAAPVARQAGDRADPD